MLSSLYVGVAAQAALLKRLDALANNVANAGTVGFRADGLSFRSVISNMAANRTAFPDAGRDYVSTGSGAMTKTGNPMDVAVRGAGWLSLMSPDGQVYTRNGRLQLTATGELTSVNGYPVLDVSGAPILADPAAGPLSIAGDGTMTQGKNQLGALGLFLIDPAARLTRYDNSSVNPDRPPTPILDFTQNGVLQGYVEQSNVNPVLEMTRLIQIQRAFESMTAAIEATDATRQDAIRTLGATS